MAGDDDATRVSGAASPSGPSPFGIGPWRIVRELGAGGMGRVFLAEADAGCRVVPPGTRVALKRVHPHLVEAPGFFKRFLLEADIGRRVRHPNVVRTLDADATNEGGVTLPYLVLEYVEGRTLRALLEDLGRVPEALCLHIAHEIARGLEAIHAAGVVHRDLKPENVLITADDAVKVMDLGIARLADEALRLSLTGAFVGTVGYAAPEQIAGGSAVVDGRADLYSLGLLLHELSTGRPAFGGDDLPTLLLRRLREDPRPLATLNPQVSPFFEEVVRHLTFRDREARFPAARALAEVLQEGEASPWWLRRAGEIRAATRRPLRRIRIPRETAVRGRDAEIDRLRVLLREARGAGRVVLIEGEAGIGKSRLVDEFVGGVQAEGVDLEFLFGSYPIGGSATVAGAFTTALLEHLGGDGLEQALAPLLETVPRSIPAFAAFLRGEPPPRGEEPLSKETLQGAFIAAVRGLGERRPVVLLVDDLHAAPAEGRALFLAVAAGIVGRDVLLVGTSRPGLPAEWAAALDRMEHASRLPLERLGPRDLQRLLADAFRSEALAEELGGRIGARSDGNPFFVFEILRALREGGALARGPDGTWTRAGALGEIALPDSVADLIRARIGRLDEPERNLLDVAAVCGFEFDPLLVCEALGLGRIPVLQRLGSIEKSHRLVRAAGRRFVFDHHQVHEVLYRGLSDLLREEYHAAVAEALQRRPDVAGKDPGSIPGARALELADHHLRGGRGEAALPFLDGGLRHLERAFHNEAALELVDRALSMPDLLAGPARLPWLGRKETLCWLLLRWGENVELLREARDLADAAGDDARRVSLRKSLQVNLANLYRNEEDREVCVDLLRVARELGDPDAERAAVRGLASIDMREGRYEAVRPPLEEHLRLARESGDDTLRLRTIGTLIPVSLGLGLYGRALELAEERLQWLGAVDREGRRLDDGADHADPRTAREATSGGAIALASIAHVHAVLGDHARGRALLDEGVEVARRVGFRILIEYEPAMRGEFARLAGDPQEALRLLREAASRGAGVYPLREMATVCVQLGSVLVQLGRIDEAREPLERAADLASRVRFPDNQALAAAYSAHLPGADGPGARAAYEARKGAVAVRPRMEAAHVLGDALGDAGLHAEARGLLAHLVAHAPERHRATMVGNVAIYRAVAATGG